MSVCTCVSRNIEFSPNTSIRYIPNFMCNFSLFVFAVHVCTYLCMFVHIYM